MRYNPYQYAAPPSYPQQQPAVMIAPQRRAYAPNYGPCPKVKKVKKVNKAKQPKWEQYVAPSPSAKVKKVKKAAKGQKKEKSDYTKWAQSVRAGPTYNEDVICWAFNSFYGCPNDAKDCQWVHECYDTSTGSGYDICWAFNTKQGCRNGTSCEWKHVKFRIFYCMLSLFVIVCFLYKQSPIVLSNDKKKYLREQRCKELFQFVCWLDVFKVFCVCLRCHLCYFLAFCWLFVYIYSDPNSDRNISFYITSLYYQFTLQL